jgi:hypothetical protein
MTKIDEILTNPTTSNWLRDTLTSALDRDPVDVDHDMEALSEALFAWLPSELKTTVERTKYRDEQHMEAHAINHDRNCQTPPDHGFCQQEVCWCHMDRQRPGFSCSMCGCMVPA